MAITGVVLVGLVGSTVVSVWIELPDHGTLPGVALGSQMILVVERALALFSAWMVALVVVVRALAGELPSEISGRGMRYADAESTQGAATNTESALNTVLRDVADLRDAVFLLETDRDL